MRIVEYDHPQSAVLDTGTGFIGVKWSAAAERVDYPDGTRGPREWMAFDFTGPEGSPYYLVEFAVDEDGVPRVEAVAVCSRRGGREVQASDLRQLRPLEHLLEESFDLVSHHPGVGPDADFEAMDALRRRTLRGVRRQARRRFTEATGAEVARVYVAAMDTGAPTKAVKERFGLADSTASLYVKRSRPLIDQLLKERNRGKR